MRTDITGVPVADNTINMFSNGTLVDGATGTVSADTDYTNNEDLFIGGGSGWFAGPRELSGDIAEIIILNFAATGQEVLDVNAYLGQKYALTVEPGGDAAEGLVLLGGVKRQILTDVSRDPGSGDLSLT